MITIILLIGFIILTGHLFLKINKKINILKKYLTYTTKLQLSEDKLYLLKEINNKSTFNLNFLHKEIEKLKIKKQNEFKVYIREFLKNKSKENKDFIIKELEEKNIEVKKHIDKKLNNFKKAIYQNLNQKQQDLVSKEFKNLRNNVSQDMEDLVERIMNSRIL